MRRRKIQPGTLKFVVIAIIFMLLMDQFVFGGKRSYIEEAKQISAERKAHPRYEPPVRVEPPEGKAFFESPPLPERGGPGEGVRPTPDEQHSTPSPKPSPSGRGLKEEGDERSVHAHPKIAIIIDDLGMDVKHSRQVLDLPAPVTLAFLPYGTKTKEFSAIGKSKGHEMIIHVPMEAMDSKLNIGPGGLKSGMKPDDFEAAFKIMMGSFDGYVGINNHMGSRLTQDRAAMDHLMVMLAEAKLFFVDSKTIQSSVAADEAADAGVPYAERDVFLDHVETSAAVVAALANAERVARRNGSAIAIGHPKAVTIEALKAWIPTLEAKGIELVKVSEVLRVPKATALPLPEGEGRGEGVRPTPDEQHSTPSPEPSPHGRGSDNEEVHEELVPSVDLFPEEVPVTTPFDPVSGEPVPRPLQPQTQSPAPSSHIH